MDSKFQVHQNVLLKKESAAVITQKKSGDALKLLGADATTLSLGDATHEGGDLIIYRDGSANTQVSIDADAASNGTAFNLYGGAVIQNYLTVGQTTLNTGYPLYVNGTGYFSSYLRVNYLRTLVGVLSRDDNQASLPINIPISGTDATDHEVQLQIDSNDIIVAKATGDGAGGITNPKVIAYKPLHITAAADADGLILGGTATEGCNVSIYRDGSGNKQLSIDADAASNAKAVDIYGGVVAQNYLTVGTTTLNTAYPLAVTGQGYFTSHLKTSGSLYFLTSSTGIFGNDNAAGLSLGIGVTGTDATDHAIKLQIDSNDIIVAKATGDGAGGIIGKRAIITGGICTSKVDAGAADYNPSAVTSDYIITVDTTAAARAVVISAEDKATGSAANPRIFIIKDIAGNAGTNNITVSLETAGTIDGAASVTISANYDSITLLVDGTNGYVI